MRRSRSRSPLNSDDNDDAEVSNEDAHLFGEDNDESLVNCNVIQIENIPKYWNYERAKIFVQDITKSDIILKGITYVKMLNLGENAVGSCLVIFNNSYASNLAMKEWSALSEQRKIRVKYDYDNHLRRTRKQKKAEYKKTNVNTPSKSETDFNNMATSSSNENETYGLSLNFLQNLKIKLPLGTQLYVSNLLPKVDATKLREVFGFAGNVVNVLVFTNEGNPPRCFAKVEFDHPVEAVQAISMFHNQELFGRPMLVQMDMKQSRNIPSGLSGIGPGLGAGGMPLRGVRNAVEVEPMKRTLIEEFNKLKEAKTKQDTNVSNINPFQQAGAIFPTNNQMPVIPSQNNPFVAPTPVMPWNFLTPQPVPMPNMQLLPNTNQQDTSVLQQAVNSILQNQNKMAPNATDVSQTSIQTSQWQSSAPGNIQNDSTQSGYTRMDNRSNDYRHQKNDNQMKMMNEHRYDERGYTRSSSTSREEDRSNSDQSDMLLFKNLPSTVSLKVLNSKMREVGEVKFAELTGNGRAIVRFFNTRDAERCIKLFDKSKVDGKIIDVRYF